MSRIGRMPIPLPGNVKVEVDENNTVVVESGGKRLERTLPADMKLIAEDGVLRIERPSESREHRSLHGLTRTLIANMVEGVTNGYEKKLEIVGTGYRVVAKGSDLEFALGYSHSITVKAPEGISFTTDGPLRLSVQGIDKQQVGEVAANIRKLRKPDPYKGKGVRYAGEHIRRKVGKAGK
jgi:large subunit ribosomal protein L6